MIAIALTKPYPSHSNLTELIITPDGSDKKNQIVNTGTPWNEAQIRALTIGFPDSPTKEVAHIVGRSVYEVNKKAKELGLKKSPKYLKAIRTANLKKKTK